jgi:hypothetical protein
MDMSNTDLPVFIYSMDLNGGGTPQEFGEAMAKDLEIRRATASRRGALARS